jgi:hypothetical protein
LTDQRSRQAFSLGSAGVGEDDVIGAAMRSIDRVSNPSGLRAIGYPFPCIAGRFLAEQCCIARPLEALIAEELKGRTKRPDP